MKEQREKKLTTWAVGDGWWPDWNQCIHRLLLFGLTFMYLFLNHFSASFGPSKNLTKD